MGRLQTARLENFIRRWGSIKGEGSVLSETLGDVFPVLDLENLTPENQLTAGWSLFWGFASVTGVVAQLSGVSCINPADSGQLVVVDGVIARPQNSSILTLGSSQPLFTTVVATSARDRRSALLTGRALIGANANAAGIETGLAFRVAAGIDGTIELPNGIAVLPPGTQVACITATADDDLSVTFYGRARTAEPSELSF